jgi:tetratricopeptide (TPR) repeat protein
MAKHCNVCNQSYSDDLTSCPHCAEAAAVRDAAHLVEQAEGDSGISAIASEAPTPSRTDVARHIPHSAAELRLADTVPPPPAAPTAAPDAHADIDLERPHAAGQSEPISGESAIAWSSLVDDGEEAPVQIDSPSDVDLLRYARPPGQGPGAPAAAAEETSAVNLAAGGPGSVPSASSGLSSPSGEGPPPSGLGLVSDALEEGFSGVLMRGADDPTSERSIAPGPEHRHTPLPLPIPSESDFAAEEELSRLEGASVDLGAPPPAGERPSGRDLIAEAVESGVGLPKTTGPGTEGRAIERSRQADAGDSAVDLAAMGPVVGSPSDLFASRSMRSSSGGMPTDLSLRDLPAESMIQPGGSEVEQEPDGAIEEETTTAKEAPPTPRSKTVRTAAGPRAQTATPWLAGGAVGALAGVLLCMVLWLFGVEPPAGMRIAGPAPSGPSKQITPNPSTNPVAAEPTLGSALADVKNGELDKALPVLEAAGDEPDRLAARGEVRWLNYLKQQREKGASPSANDDPVKSAIDDLTKAKTPQAVFWLGHIEERVGNRDKARDLYLKAMTEFPNEKRLFQAALDHLDSREAEQSGALLPRAADELAEADHLALILTALQGDNPPAASDADEAGYLFWNAAKLAKEGKYADAIKALDEARALHDKKRFTRVRKAQNPSSDPDEEIFLKCCAELKSYWHMRELLNDGGYPVGPKQTAVAALEAALKAAKGGADVEALKKNNTQLAKDLDAEKKKSADTLAEAKQESLKAKDEIAKTKDQAAKVAKDFADKVKAAEEQARASEAKVKGASARLEAAGIKTPDLPQGIDELAAARTDAETKLAELGKPTVPHVPVTGKTTNFLAADEHYTSGLRLYSDRNFTDAEKEFLAAVENDGQDARYFYYLGLMRVLLNKRDAAVADFEQAAKLEKQGRPDRETVSDALERVQGASRQEVNRFRR